MAEIFSSTGDSMLSLEHIAVVKLAIQVCCGSKMKRKLLFTPYGVGYELTNIWHETIEEETSKILEEFRLPETLQRKVISAVFLIGMRMVIWAEYHEGIAGFSREFCCNFLNASFLTPQGLVDNKKAARELLDVNCLAIHQKYKIACVYCFIDDIFVLFKQVSLGDFEKYTCATESALVKYWTHYLKVDGDSIKAQITQDGSFLEAAIKNGSKTSVEHYFEQCNLTRKEFNLVHAALEAVRNRMKVKEDDWFIFQKPYPSDSWVPNDYYVDIVLFLLSKMGEYEQIEFLQKDIEGFSYERRPFGDHKRSRVLEYLLKWPYQDNLLKIVNLMWDFLPERNYGVLLRKICDWHIPKLRHVNAGEDEIYDYMGLLKKFWYQSPERFKRYVFTSETGEYSESIIVVLVKKFLEFKKFASKEAGIIQFIIASAMEKEKENIFASIGWKSIFIQLLVTHKWKLLDLLTVNCFSTKEEANKFKREFIFTEAALLVFINFVAYENWKCVESAIKWSSLLEDEIYKLKKEIINSVHGKKSCEFLVWGRKYERFDRIVMWSFPSAEEVKSFKKEIVNRKSVMSRVVELWRDEALAKDFHELINFFFSSVEEIKQFKKDVAYTVGVDFCTRYISSSFVHTNFLLKKRGNSYEFRGSNWEQVELFLTWCFSSEEEINEFKRKKIKALAQIHHDLVLASQFEEAERYFDWLGLSASEIKEHKRDDFFNTYMIDDTFLTLIYTERGDYHFPDFGSDQEAIELLLRWYLTDRETVLEFSNEFKHKYFEDAHVDEARNRDALKIFDLAIAQQLRDLEEEQIGMKIKSENSSSTKKLHS